MSDFGELIKEAIETIKVLHDEICDAFEEFGFLFPIFELHTDGNGILIMFMNSIQLWYSDDDEREYNEEKDEYESLEGYLRREAQKIIDQIAVLKLVK